MGKLRFLFALWMAKLSVPALKITRHNGTDFPGTLHKRIHNGPARHPHRTFHNLNIFFICPDISFFITNICITFSCRYKTRCNLNAIHSKAKSMLCRCSVINAAGQYDRN